MKSARVKDSHLSVRSGSEISSEGPGARGQALLAGKVHPAGWTSLPVYLAKPPGCITEYKLSSPKSKNVLLAAPPAWTRLETVAIWPKLNPLNPFPTSSPNLLAHSIVSPQTAKWNRLSQTVLSKHRFFLNLLPCGQIVSKTNHQHIKIMQIISGFPLWPGKVTWGSSGFLVILDELLVFYFKVIERWGILKPRGDANFSYKVAHITLSSTVFKRKKTHKLYLIRAKGKDHRYLKYYFANKQ